MFEKRNSKKVITFISSLVLLGMFSIGVGNAYSESMDKEAMREVLYDYVALTQQPNAPLQEDTLKSKEIKTEDVKEQVAFIQNSKVKREKVNEKTIENLCSPKFSEITKEFYLELMPKDGYDLSGVGGGIVDILSEKWEIDGEKAMLEAHLIVDVIDQIVDEEGKIYNRKLESPIVSKYYFIKINDQWYIDGRELIEYDMSTVKATTQYVDDIEKQFIKKFTLTKDTSSS